MDLESVKVCPNLNTSAIFFKTKLCCHNFTIYNLKTHSATCYWFTEVDSDLQASTFVFCLLDYLKENCVNKNLPVIIYSDGCTYQNRNCIVANALLNFSMKYKIEIYQKFLEREHTQMECDTVHSCIERKIKGKEIYLPSDYVRATKEARKVPMPYEFKIVDYHFLMITVGKNICVTVR